MLAKGQLFLAIASFSSTAVLEWCKLWSIGSWMASGIVASIRCSRDSCLDALTRVRGLCSSVLVATDVICVELPQVCVVAVEKERVVFSESLEPSWIGQTRVLSEGSNSFRRWT
jgi:hypothetical protein